MTDTEHDGDLTPNPSDDFSDLDLDDSELPFDVLFAKRHHTPTQRRELKAKSRLLPRGGVAHPDEPNIFRPRLAIYLRISHLTNDSISIARQYKACLAEVKRLGGVFDKRTDLFHDVSVSASKGHYRVGMEDFLARVEEDGAYDGVVIWEFPRALRSYAESLNFRNILFQGSCELYIVTTPQIRLFGPSASFFDLFVQVAEGEALAMSERALSRHRFMRTLGAVQGKAMFGLRASEVAERVPGRANPIRRFVPDTTPREEFGGKSAAGLVREAFEGFIDGRSLRSIALEWNRAGYPSPLGAGWSSIAVHRLLANPAMAGLAHWHRKLVGDDGEVLPQGSTEPPLKVHEGVLTVEEWQTVQAVFVARTRLNRGTNEPPLRGLVRCGRCSRVVSRHARTYHCVDYNQGGLRCGGYNSATSSKLEEFVQTAALEVLKSRKLRDGAWAMNRSERHDDAQRLEDQIAALHRQLDELEGMWLTATEKDAAARERFGRRRVAAESELTRRKNELATITVKSHHSHLDKLYADDGCVQEAFLAAPAHLQVSVLHELIERVMLHPSPTNRWAEDRVEIVWATF